MKLFGFVLWSAGFIQRMQFTIICKSIEKCTHWIYIALIKLHQWWIPLHYTMDLPRQQNYLNLTFKCLVYFSSCFCDSVWRGNKSCLHSAQSSIVTSSSRCVCFHLSAFISLVLLFKMFLRLPVTLTFQTLTKVLLKQIKWYI